jgi:hypothetical protein
VHIRAPRVKAWPHLRVCQGGRACSRTRQNLQGSDRGAGALHAQLSHASRQKRAKDKAIANWRKRARDAYGWMYRFWSKAQEQRVDCGGTAKFKRCSVSAKPRTLR